MYTGKIIHGSKISSSVLGIPTANLDIKNIVIDQGIYYGYASFEDSPNVKYKCVLSIGLNPTFNTTTFEVHIIHKFDTLFYDKFLIVDIVGFIRKSIKYNSMDKLIEQIQNDIKYALDKLNNV